MLRARKATLPSIPSPTTSASSLAVLRSALAAFDTAARSAPSRRFRGRDELRFGKRDVGRRPGVAVDLGSKQSRNGREHAEVVDAFDGVRLERGRTRSSNEER